MMPRLGSATKHEMHRVALALLFLALSALAPACRRAGSGAEDVHAADAGAVAAAVPAIADVLPPERRTQWQPGIPGGVPVRTTVCASVDAARFGNGAVDATGGIQAAIDACPEGQVVRLSAGDFLVDGEQPI